jgi:hypothetical protein
VCEGGHDINLYLAPHRGTLRTLGRNHIFPNTYYGQ